MAYLEITEGYNKGMVLYLGQETSIGRSPENGLCLPDSRASRKHAIITLSGSNYLLNDNGSSNGTHVNGERLGNGQQYALQDNDEIRICSTRILFHGDQTKHKMFDSGVMAAVISEETASIGASMDADANLTAVDQATTPARLLQIIERLQAMVKVANDLGEVTGRQAIIQGIMQSIFDIFPAADRAFVMLRDPDSGELAPFDGRHRKEEASLAEEKVTISRTIMSAAVEGRQSVLSSDAQSDQRFGKMDSIMDLSIRSLMCAPFLWRDEVLGILHVDTTSSLQAFNEDDLAMLTGIASQAAGAIKNAELYEVVRDETEKRALLSRYMSPDVAQGVLDGKIPLELGGRTAHGTVMFCDILGFTNMSEVLPALEVVNKLNRHFRITTEIVSRHKGTLHKFGGDMIMAFWNVMFEDEHHAYNAIMTGIQMQSAVWAFDMSLLHEGQPPIYMGVGINTGSFAAGNVGGEGCMEYTVIGDNVNVAQRIEQLATRWQVLVSETTFAPIADRCMAVELPLVNLKGRSAPIRVYSIRGLASRNDRRALCVPVDIVGPDGNHAGTGMLTEVTGEGEAMTVSLATACSLPAEKAVALQWKLPEMKRTFTMGAHVSDAHVTEHHGTAIFSRLSLNHLRGDAEVLNFLQPGSVLQSQRSWTDMRRH